RYPATFFPIKPAPMDYKTKYIDYIIAGESNERVLRATVNDRFDGLRDLIYGQNEDSFPGVLPEGLKLVWETPGGKEELNSEMKDIWKVLSQGYGHIRVHFHFNRSIDESSMYCKLATYYKFNLLRPTLL
ncbi:hypothetical protein BGZ75_007367, partial [Mortierella antarctica]